MISGGNILQKVTLPAVPDEKLRTLTGFVVMFVFVFAGTDKGEGE